MLRKIMILIFIILSIRFTYSLIQPIFVQSNIANINKVNLTYHIIIPSIGQFQKNKFEVNNVINNLQFKLSEAYNQQIPFSSDSANILIHILPVSIIEVYEDLKNNNGDKYLKIIKNYSKENSINIYIITSIKSEKKIDGKVLLGFTPVLNSNLYKYEQYTPIYDNIFVTYYETNINELYSTVIHEVGHFLGQKHVFEMNQEELKQLGLTSSHLIKHNYMNYGDSIDQFTTIQIDKMHTFLYEFRTYMIEN